MLPIFWFASFLTDSGSGHELKLPFGGRSEKHTVIKNGNHQHPLSLAFLALRVERSEDSGTAEPQIHYYVRGRAGKGSELYSQAV